VNAPNVEKHIGQYKIVRTLGAGGMGTVYLGEHLLLGRRAAIKTLLPSLSSHREIVDRFFNEARAISAISDPGVVQVFDFGYHVDGTAFIVMEFLEGESLSARLERLTKLPLVDALRLARQLSSSLAAAHDRDIIHRDLKPGNVFVIRDPEVPGGERTKILDFGICKLGDPECATTTQTGTMLGTPVYMSPEQCRGAGRVDHRSDIYSVGCVLFHMIAGRPPFDCESVGDYIASHIKDDAPVPSSVAPELPPAVDALLTRCLAKDPDDRFPSMAELQQAIEQVLANLSDSGTALAGVGVPKFLATPLGEGFQSSYDVNRGNQLRTVDLTASAPSHVWFVDSLLPVVHGDDDDYDLVPPRTSWGRRFALVAALGIGVVTGLVGTSYVLAAQTLAGAPPPGSPELAPVEEAATSYASTVVESAPPEPVAEEAVVAAAPVAPPKKMEAARSHHTRASKPARPRPVVRAQKPQPQPAEDLYDSR
jgi:serine/threonine protein kinase